MIQKWTETIFQPDLWEFALYLPMLSPAYPVTWTTSWEADIPCEAYKVTQICQSHYEAVFQDLRRKKSMIVMKTYNLSILSTIYSTL